MRSLGLLLLLSLSFFPLAQDAGAVTQSFGFVAPIAGEGGFVADVDLVFDFDETCTTGCTLGIMATYNDVGGIPDQGKAFSTVLFSVVSRGSITFDRSASQVLAETLVGTDVGSVTLPMVGSAYDVSPHFAFDPAVVLGPGYGTIALGSVGDILFGVDTLGNGDLLPGTPSGEDNPPDGWPYTLVDASSTGFNKGNKFDVVIQTTWTASLAYEGQLSGVTNVAPLFGTDGAPVIPEPSAMHLFPIGLLVAAAARHGQRRRTVA
ncbi:MAG: hypothetical protein JRH10_20455 [Deltaproteobacteria bacterium]|nr:hypothetical protein [Deltaproteobacteria bacterium]